MRSRPITIQRPAKRKVPETELKIIKPLAETMSRAWRDIPPPNSSLAGYAVYGKSFMGIRKLSPFFKQVLGNGRLLDLGAGEPDAMMHFALRSGVGEYVAVDRYLNYSGKTPPFANVLFVNQDMLMFLAEQPDESASVVMLAIDNIVLSGPSTISETLYRGMLLAEIARVVPPGGIAFGMNCDLLIDLTDMGFRRLDQIPGHQIPENWIIGGIFQKRG